MGVTCPPASVSAGITVKDEDGSIVGKEGPRKVDVMLAEVDNTAHPCESPVAVNGLVLVQTAIYQMEPSGWLCCYLTWLLSSSSAHCCYTAPTAAP